MHNKQKTIYKVLGLSNSNTSEQTKTARNSALSLYTHPPELDQSVHGEHVDGAGSNRSTVEDETEQLQRHGCGNVQHKSRRKDVVITDALEILVRTCIIIIEDILS